MSWKTLLMIVATIAGLGFGEWSARTSAATLVSIGHDGSAADENNPFDTNVLSQGANWTYTNDGGRTVATALDNSGSGNNRLIVIQADGVTQFTDTGTAADKGWVFETELKILQGNASGRAFANFGVRSENGDGKAAWVGLTDDGGTGDTGQIAFINPSGTLSGITAPLDVDSLIGDGQYHNFKIHKYDNSGTTTVDVFMDGSLVLTTPYASIIPDSNQSDIQGFASNTPTPLSEVNIDFINFKLHDNLIASNPDPNAPPILLVDFNGDSHDGGPQASVADFQAVIAEDVSGAFVTQFDLGDNPSGTSFTSDSGPSVKVSFSDDPNAADKWDAANDLMEDGFFFRGAQDSTTVDLEFGELLDNTDYKLYLFTGRVTSNVASGHSTEFFFNGDFLAPGPDDLQVSVFQFTSGIDQTSLTFDWFDSGNPNADPDRILSGFALVALPPAIPEPSTVALAMLGLASVARRRRRA